MARWVTHLPTLWENSNIEFMSLLAPYSTAPLQPNRSFNLEPKIITPASGSTNRSTRINWREPEYASKGKEGVANRFHPLEEIGLPKETEFCAWVAVVRNIVMIPLGAISPPATLYCAFPKGCEIVWSCTLFF